MTGVSSNSSSSESRPPPRLDRKRPPLTLLWAWRCCLNSHIVKPGDALSHLDFYACSKHRALFVARPPYSQKIVPIAISRVLGGGEIQPTIGALQPERGTRFIGPRPAASRVIIA